MSALEEEIKPVIGCAMQDVSVSLDRIQQNNIALWAIKTSMVAEAIDPTRTPFYQKSERLELRYNSVMPAATTVWLGRFSGSSLLAQGTDIWIDIAEGLPKTPNGYVSTILVGHLVVQILSIRISPKYGDRTITIRPNAGPWGKLLVAIWPIHREISWPPDFTFSLRGNFPIDLLRRRWKIGISV